MPVVFAQAGQWPGDLERRPHLSLPGAELRAGVDRLPNTCRQRHRAEEQSRQGWEEAGALRRSLTLGRGWTATEQAGEKPSEAPGARGEAEEGGNPTPVSHQRDGRSPSAERAPRRSRTGRHQTPPTSPPTPGPAAALRFQAGFGEGNPSRLLLACISDGLLVSEPWLSRWISAAGRSREGVFSARPLTQADSPPPEGAGLGLVPRPPGLARLHGLSHPQAHQDGGHSCTGPGLTLPNPEDPLRTGGRRRVWHQSRDGFHEPSDTAWGTNHSRRSSNKHHLNE